MSKPGTNPPRPETPVSTYSAVPHYVYGMQGFTPNILAVLEALIYFAGPGYECAPLRNEIRDRASVSTNAFLRAIRWLKANQIIAEDTDRNVVTGRKFSLLWRRADVKRTGTHKRIPRAKWDPPPRANGIPPRAKWDPPPDPWWHRPGPNGIPPIIRKS